MLTYTFSRREKVLIFALVLIIVAVLWFVFVFQRTNDQINKIDADIATVQSQTTLAQAQVERKNTMQKVIDKYKEAGVSPTQVPDFDNMTPLMSALNGTLRSTTNYSLSFDQLDTKTSADYVLRGVTIDFSCGSFGAAENVINALRTGQFPCSIDSVSISDGGARSSRAADVGASSVSAAVHVTYFEKAQAKSAASGASGTAATNASTTSQSAA